MDRGRCRPRVGATTRRHGPSCVHCAPSASLGWSATEEAGISADDEAKIAKRARDYTEAWIGEDEALQSARRRGQELGAVPIGPGGGAVLRFLAATGRALDVLPRLTDGGYDLVFCDAAKAEYGDYLREALRLLRPGGIIAFDNALWHGRVPDSSNRDSETVAVRELLRQVHDDERLTPVLLGAGDGLLAAVKGA